MKLNFQLNIIYVTKIPEKAMKKISGYIYFTDRENPVRAYYVLKQFFNKTINRLEAHEIKFRRVG